MFIVHVSCYPDHYEPKIFFSIFEVRNYPSIYDFGLESRLSRFPLKMRSQKAGLPFATRARKRELSIQEVRIENDLDRKFSKSQFFKVFLKPLFSTIHDTLFIISRSVFFKVGKNENFDYKMNENCPIGIRKIGKK